MQLRIASALDKSVLLGIAWLNILDLNTALISPFFKPPTDEFWTITPSEGR